VSFSRVLSLCISLVVLHMYKTNRGCKITPPPAARLGVAASQLAFEMQVGHHCHGMSTASLSWEFHVITVNTPSLAGVFDVPGALPFAHGGPRRDRTARQGELAVAVSLFSCRSFLAGRSFSSGVIHIK
jgi:hypothetical protein